MALEAWMQQHRPELLKNYQSDGGYYVDAVSYTHLPIVVPSLRERPEDIPLLFRKFAADVAVQYRMPAVTLDEGARQMLMHYYWRGNIRQLKNVAEQISAIEQARVITAEVLSKYLPRQEAGAPVAAGSVRMDDDMSTERELLYNCLLYTSSGMVRRLFVGVDDLRLYGRRRFGRYGLRRRG